MRDVRISGEMDMRNVIKIVTILAFIGSRGAIAQTLVPARSSAEFSSPSAGPLSVAQDTIIIHEAPIGHRQPRVSDVPPQGPSEIERLTPEDATIDRKLGICRGC
jgi:hypothetical protein